MVQLNGMLWHRQHGIKYKKNFTPLDIYNLLTSNTHTNKHKAILKVPIEH